MGFELHRDDGLMLCDDPDRLDMARVRAWLASSYWASDRSAESIERSVQHSRSYGVYTPAGEHVALTRVTTDLASFAWLGDVFVDEAWRGHGIGRWMVGAVVDHLRGFGVPRFVLTTRDAHGVYTPLGFEPLRVPQTWMEIDLRTTRPNASDVSVDIRPAGTDWPG
ncbi:MAG: GNAT family N-acetyltransferase [Pseudonocardiales bacterium]|nr:MAG: GNAT family N-acetyltransferase [Pseudonocardiales bacterium]